MNVNLLNHTSHIDIELFLDTLLENGYRALLRYTCKGIHKVIELL